MIPLNEQPPRDLTSGPDIGNFERSAGNGHHHWLRNTSRVMIMYPQMSRSGILVLQHFHSSASKKVARPGFVVDNW